MCEDNFALKTKAIVSFDVAVQWLSSHKPADGAPTYDTRLL